MSVKKLLPRILGLLGGVIAVAYGVHRFTKPVEVADVSDKGAQRRAASAGPKGYLAMGKPNRAMDIRVVEVPVEGFSGTKLGATVMVTRPIESSIQMEWEIPEGVQLLSGDREFWIHSLTPGESYYTEIELTGLSPEVLETVRLGGSVQIAGAPIAAEGVYSTQVMQRDLSHRQRAPASLNGILNRKAALKGEAEQPTRLPKLHF